MKTTHTPGPWVVNSGMVETVTGVPIARMDREPGNGTMPVERDCNAYLCAAAPELLDALETLLYWRDLAVNHGKKQVKFNIDLQMFADAEAAIKLARKND